MMMNVRCTRRAVGATWAMAIAVCLACIVGAARADVLTNDSILEMHAIGLGPEVVVQAIESSRGDYDTSLDALRRLNAAGLADEVIAAMMQVTSSADHRELVMSDDPRDPHPPGVYLFEEINGAPRMTRLEPSVYSQVRTGNVFAHAITGGIAKAKMKAALGGPSARLQVTSREPVFYWYFAQQGAGIGQSRGVVAQVLGHGLGAGFGATSPNEFVLLRAKVRRGRSREIVVGQMNAFGAQQGALDNHVVPFDYELVRPDVYRVFPQQPLEPGEYCFVRGTSTGQGTAGKVFDFGVPEHARVGAPATAARRAAPTPTSTPTPTHAASLAEGPSRAGAGSRSRRAAPDAAPEAAPVAPRGASSAPPQRLASVSSAARPDAPAALAVSGPGVVRVPVRFDAGAVRLDRMRDEIVVRVACRGRSAVSGVEPSSLRLLTVDGAPIGGGGLAPIAVDERSGACVRVTFSGPELADRLAAHSASGRRVALGVGCLLGDGRRAGGEDSLVVTGGH